MKLSRLWGAAVTCGTLLGGGSAFAQVPHYQMPGYQPPGVGYAVPQASALPSAYPSTDGYGYMVASLPAATTQFNSPSNVPVTRLPLQQPQASFVAHPQVAHMGPTQAPAPTGPIQAPAHGSPTPTAPEGTPYGSGTLPNYGAAPIYGSGYGYGSGSGGAAGGIYGGGSPILGGGVAGPVAGSCAAGSASAGGAFQPFNCAPPPAVGGGWYVGGYGLWLTRDRQDHYTFSYDTGNEAIQYTDAKDAHVGWGGGFATVIGHYFNCGQNAVEAVYWGWFPEDDSVYTYGGSAIGDLSGIFNWDSLTYNGQNMGVFVDDAEVHSLYRQNEAHNVEVNILTFGGTGYSNARFTGLAGFRYFRFRDNLLFASDPNDTAFTGEVDEVYYNIDTVNSLVGFQIGGLGTYCPTQRLSINGGAKIGFFGNHITHVSQIGGTAGTAVINNGPNTGREFYVNNSKNDVAFLAEVFLGVGYCLTPRWTATAGYRAIALTGLASPTDQIYPDLRGINDLETIESQSSMILHGAYFGAQFCF